MQGLNPNGKLQMVKVDADGKLVVTGVSGGGGGSGTSDTTEATQLLVKLAVQNIDAKNPVLVGGKVPVTDPTALPLPTGAATAANQISANTALTSIDAKTPSLIGGKVPVTDPVALPLPTGAATSSLQDAANTRLVNIDVDIGDRADAAATTDGGTFSLISLAKRALGNWTTLLARIPALVSGKIPVTDPVALPLPSGAATAAKQDAAVARFSRFAGLELWQADDQGAGTAYVQYRNSFDSAISWYVVRYVTSAGITTITYAGPANNTGQASATTAWTNRATLTYGAPFEA